MSHVGMGTEWELEKIGRAAYAYPPRPYGKIFFVDHFTGDNKYDGQNRHYPLKTITEALGQCVGDHDDVIIVLRAWREVTETWPISVDVSRVHIIGMSGMQGKHVAMVPPADDTPVFRIPGTGPGCEIAGFTLGAGDTSPCIEIVNPINVWIHDCWFGNQYHLEESTPQDGICMTHLNAANARIERCRFFGDAHGKGGISRDGIRDVLSGAGAGNTFRNSEIINNRFSGLITAIHLLNPGDAIIEHNYINCGVDQAVPANPAGGINLQGGVGCLIANNKAGRGSGGMTNNPYYDDDVTGTLNAWLCNQKDHAWTMPDHPQL